MNTRLGIIAHKHMFAGDGPTVELDLEQLAFEALGRAIADYIVLSGSEEPFVKAYLNWTWKNKDGPAAMEAFKSVPARLKPKS
jgi:hypothetical protein